MIAIVVHDDNDNDDDDADADDGAGFVNVGPEFRN